MSLCRFVETPNLPQSSVRLLAIGECGRSELETPLRALSIDCLWLPADSALDARVSAHADLLAAHMGGDCIVGADERIVNLLTNRGFRAIKAKSPRAAAYPGDIALNVCIVGGALFHRLDCTDAAVLELARGLKLVNVHQGYSRCSTCIVTDSAIITADAGIAKSAAQLGIEALIINNEGGIELEGFAHGFIGGASFKLAPDKLAFTGRLYKHPDARRVEEFIRAHGVEPIYLTERPAFDIGSAIPLICG